MKQMLSSAFENGATAFVGLLWPPLSSSLLSSLWSLSFPVASGAEQRIFVWSSVCVIRIFGPVVPTFGGLLLAFPFGLVCGGKRELSNDPMASNSVLIASNSALIAF